MATNSSNKTFKLNLFELVPQLMKKLPEKLPNIILNGIPALLSSDKDVNSIGKVLEDNAIRFKGKNALLFEDKKWSHKDLNQISNQYAHMFHQFGVNKQLLPTYWKLL